jgi:hypothetical protein
LEIKVNLKPEQEFAVLISQINNRDAPRQEVINYAIGLQVQIYEIHNQLKYKLGIHGSPKELTYEQQFRIESIAKTLPKMIHEDLVQVVSSLLSQLFANQNGVATFINED